MIILHVYNAAHQIFHSWHFIFYILKDTQSY